MEKFKEYYCVKVLGTRKDLAIRFIIMTVIDTVLLYAFSFVQDILYDVGVKAAYSNIAVYILISVWALYVFIFMIIAFNSYIDFSQLNKILFKK